MLSQELLQGHRTVQKLSSMMALSVSEELTQRTGESLYADRSQRRRRPNTGWQGIPGTCSSHRECSVTKSGSAGGWYDKCWCTRVSESATSVHFSGQVACLWEVWRCQTMQAPDRQKHNWYWLLCGTLSQWSYVEVELCVLISSQRKRVERRHLAWTETIASGIQTLQPTPNNISRALSWQVSRSAASARHLAPTNATHYASAAVQRNRLWWSWWCEQTWWHQRRCRPRGSGWQAVAEQPSCVSCQQILVWLGSDVDGELTNTRVPQSWWGWTAANWPSSMLTPRRYSRRHDVNIWWPTGSTYLCLVSACMRLQYISSVQQKQNWSKDQTLRHSIQDCHWHRPGSRWYYKQYLTGQVRDEPINDSPTKTIRLEMSMANGS